MDTIVGPLYGWRAWKLSTPWGRIWEPGTPCELRGCVYTSTWEPRARAATCAQVERAQELAAWYDEITADTEFAHSEILEAWCAPYGVNIPHEADAVPSEGCQCGWHAYKDLEAMAADPEGPLRGAAVPYVHVVGVVALWGRVEVHEHGYRAQFSRPLGLVLGEQWERASLPLRVRYGVDTAIGDITDAATVAARAEDLGVTHYTKGT